MKKKVLVTGSKGFIGSNLVKELSKQNYLVEELDEEYFQFENWEEVLLEILELKKPEAVFHVGACSNTLESRVNYMMTRNYESTKIITKWCSTNQVPLIYSSSAANYGTNNKYPSNLYGWSKYVAEDYVILSGGIALRYFNVYGPGEENKKEMASVAYQMIKKNQRGENVKLFPMKPKRDFVYVKDIISANIYAFEKFETCKGKYYEVGNGIAETFESVLDNLGIPYEYHSEDKIPVGYQFYTCSDSKKWLPGWNSEWNLEKGLRDYLSTIGL